MRTIFVHLLEATEEQVASFLTEAFPSQKGSPWIVAVAGDPCLYIRFCRNWQAESEPQEIECLRAALGGDPSVSLSADVSGRHPGDAEVREFVFLVLSEFDGVAEDEFTEGFWTKAEIVAGRRKPSNLSSRREGLIFSTIGALRINREIVPMALGAKALRKQDWNPLSSPNGYLR